ncbi:patatin-like phospholipase family protein [Haliangium sp.]|uniref:patatin-like phospholipase family protein n=1 Tax=Haliangium sp. TaxID=2663208 RepID=UPI003D0B11EC
MQPFRILAIDGGGVRGAAPASFLKELEQALGRPIHDSFDLVAGTSTGGLIALYIAGTGNTATSCCDEFYTPEILGKIMDKSLWDRVAPVQGKPTYDGKGKTAVVREVLGEKRLQEVDKKLLVTAYDFIERHIVVYKSWGGVNHRVNPLLWEIADATSAAPTFFPSVQMEDGRWLIDGGMAANNPSTCALAEAIRLGHDVENIRVLSLGTGRASPQQLDRDRYGQESRDWGAVGWMTSGKLLDHLFTGGSTAMDYLSRQILGDAFVRVDEYLTLASPATDDVSPENIDKLKAEGKAWFEASKDQVLALLGASDAGR